MPILHKEDFLNYPEHGHVPPSVTPISAQKYVNGTYCLKRYLSTGGDFALQGATGNI